MNKSKPLSNNCNLSQLSGFLKNLIDQRQDYRTELKMNNAATSSVEELQVLKLSPDSLSIKRMDASCSNNNETVRIHCNCVQSSRQGHVLLLRLPQQRACMFWLGSSHQEPPHAGVSRNLATVVVRGVLTGLRKRRTGLLSSGPKSSFQMRTSFVFHLETKALESGGRVEKLIAQVAWSPVLIFNSLWWFGLQCHLLVLVHCVFWKPMSLHLFTKKFW